MKLTQIGIIVGAIIGLNVAHADDLPAPYPASAPGAGVIEGTSDLGIDAALTAAAGGVTIPTASDNTALWQMGSGDRANVTINQNTSGVINGHTALVDTHASYKSDVVVEQSGNLNEAHVQLRGKYNNALIDQNGQSNQARVQVEQNGHVNDLRVTQMGDDNISVTAALGGADHNRAETTIYGDSNKTYTEFSNYDVDYNNVEIDISGDDNYVQTIVNNSVGGGDWNDVDIDLVNSDRNRVFVLQTGSHSDAVVQLQNSNMNQFTVEQTSNDSAVVLGNGAYGNVGIIYQN
ncbi:curlin [Vibrio splendidus]|uniref:Curlin n=1 Tax=Vibrio splendidus TaxID=29497 RepID=A0A2N7F8N4_VIBSP|nr:curlin [Vibrio splendidus]PMJ62909.1 curlin [Vibrio splendidus]